ncbi:MAG: transketolase [Dehalococcoidia bacterium]|nr:transketolase [Dehalococcoidia bacterium]
MSTEKSIPELQEIARKIRRNIVTMVAKAASGHPGGSLSAVEIVTTLYFRIMNHNPANPEWSDRDRFILSKGHCSPVLYSVLAECGYFPVEELMTFRRINSRLQGHTHMGLPGVEMSAGSLGQGLSFAVGCALAGRVDKKPYRVYTLLGDGECEEGQVWEAAMAAAHFKVDNLVAVVDRNGLQIDGWTKDVMNLEPFPDKWRAYGWHTVETDGHDFNLLIDAFEHAQAVKRQPTVIIARTVKGKGVSYMEHNVDFHGKPPNQAQLEIALKELA